MFEFSHTAEPAPSEREALAGRLFAAVADRYYETLIEQDSHPDLLYFERGIDKESKHGTDEESGQPVAVFQIVSSHADYQRNTGERLEVHVPNRERGDTWSGLDHLYAAQTDHDTARWVIITYSSGKLSYAYRVWNNGDVSFYREFRWLGTEKKRDRKRIRAEFVAEMIPKIQLYDVVPLRPTLDKAKTDPTTTEGSDTDTTEL